MYMREVHDLHIFLQRRTLRPCSLAARLYGPMHHFVSSWSFWRKNHNGLIVCVLCCVECPRSCECQLLGLMSGCVLGLTTPAPEVDGVRCRCLGVLPGPQEVSGSVWASLSWVSVSCVLFIQWRVVGLVLSAEGAHYKYDLVTTTYRKNRSHRRGVL